MANKVQLTLANLSQMETCSPKKNGLIYTEIVINAPASRVCKEFYDFESYPSWNTYIPKIEVKDKSIRLRICSRTHRGIIKRNSDTDFEWIESIMGNLVVCFHICHIIKIDEHTTKFIQEKYFNGIANRIYSSLSSKKTTGGFIAMNDALKARCESTIGN